MIDLLFSRGGISKSIQLRKENSTHPKKKCTTERNVLKGSKLTSDTVVQDNLHQHGQETL